jgi:hypothetical protein
MTRPIEKIYGATTRSKLTVTPKSATMRIRAGALDLPEAEAAESIPLEVSRTEAFFEKIIEKVQPVPKTIRGNLAWHKLSNTLYIVMKNEVGDFSERFFENEV